MTSNPTAAIVVGVDGSEQSLHALDWAAQEAVARRRPLRILHTFQCPLTSELMGPPAVGPPDAGLQHAAEKVLSATADRARTAAHTLNVGADLPADVPAAALIDASHDADLVVVGHRGLGGFSGLLIGSVGVQTAAHATCSVVVVRDSDPGSSPEQRRGEPGPAAGQVVVGVDGSDLSSLAVDFAFAHAALHGLGVVAVHAHQRPAFAAPSESQIAAADDRREVHARMLIDALARHRDEYPDVPVQEKLVHGRPAAALVAQSAGAALTVVGSRGRGGFTGLLLGSTSQSVLHHASSPVAIVRAHRTRRRRGATQARPARAVCGTRIRRSGTVADRLLPGDGGIRRLRRQPLRGHGSASVDRHETDPPVRLRRPESPVPARPDRRPQTRRVRPDRTRSRLRHTRHQQLRPAAGRRFLGTQRRETLDRQRRQRRRVRLRPYRPRPGRAHRGEGHARFRGPGPLRHPRAARQRPAPAHLPRRARPEGEHARRTRRRTAHRHAHPQQWAHVARYRRRRRHQTPHPPRRRAHHHPQPVRSPAGRVRTGRRQDRLDDVLPVRLRIDGLPDHRPRRRRRTGLLHRVGHGQDRRQRVPLVRRQPGLPTVRRAGLHGRLPSGQGVTRQPRLPHLRRLQRRAAVLRRPRRVETVADEVADLRAINLADPIGGIGVLADYVGQRVRRRLRPDRLDTAHPTLTRHGDRIAEQVGQLRATAEKLLRIHGSDIQNQQRQQKRLTHAAIDIYAQIATISRTTALFNDQGVTASGQERYVATSFCDRAATRVAEQFDRVDDNDDAQIHAVARLAYHHGGYTPRLP